MIYDCFIFYDEMLLLEIRLNELYPFVDKFVLVESTHCFSGKKKPLYYDKVKNNKIFAPFIGKIIHVIFHMSPKPNRWDNEYDQRNAIKAGLSEAKPNDIIIVSDADEIITPEVLPVIKEIYVPGRLVMKNYYYYFNCRSNNDWYYPSFCRLRDYRSAQFLRNGDYHKIIVSNAGWHFGYLMHAGRIAAKLETFSHSEYDTDFYKDENRIQHCLDTNIDLFGRAGIEYSIEPLNAPKYVMNNIDKYKKFIKPTKTKPHQYLRLH
jgi:beta-1,4-mannosyl-glycoprotein beta-1,4-N-acetylglucosaminyltransferase